MTLAVFTVLIGASAVLGLWFVAELGLPWRSSAPAMAWLQAALAAVALAFDVALLLAMWRVVVPVWVFAAILAGQDAVFSWRVATLRNARRHDIRVTETIEGEGT